MGFKIDIVVIGFITLDVEASSPCGGSGGGGGGGGGKRRTRRRQLVAREM